VIARVGVVLVALAALGWLGMSERAARLEARGVAAAERLREPGAFARAERDLRVAARHNPDTSPELARAVLYAGAGRTGPAVALLASVARREPDNRAAWAALAALTRESDPAAARRARAALARLDPLGARPR